MRSAKPGARTTPRFYRRSVLSPSVTLLARVAAALVLVGIALAGHWFDREGLRDNTESPSMRRNVLLLFWALYRLKVADAVEVKVVAIR